MALLAPFLYSRHNLIVTLFCNIDAAGSLNDMHMLICSIPPAYLAMMKDTVAAAVEATETTQTPGATPNSSPAVIVNGTAGSANTSSTA